MFSKTTTLVPPSALAHTLHERPGFLIRRAQQVSEAIFREECRATETTPTQFGVLFTLAKAGSIDQIALAKLVSMDRSTAGLVVGLLTSRGLIDRSSHPLDGRKILLTLTAAGRDLLKRLRAPTESARQRLLSAFRAAEVPLFCDLLARMADSFSPLTENEISKRVVELHTRPGFLIKRVHQMTTAVFLEECQAFDLTPTQFGVLLALQATPGSDQISIAGLVKIDRSTTSLVVTHLEGRGCIRKGPAGRDKRKASIELSQAGEALLKAAMPGAMRARSRALAALSAEDGLWLTSALKRLLIFHESNAAQPAA